MEAFQFSLLVKINIPEGGVDCKYSPGFLQPQTNLRWFCSHNKKVNKILNVFLSTQGKCDTF